MRPLASKHEVIRSEYSLAYATGDNETHSLAEEVLETALSPENTFTVFEMDSKGPTLQELFSEIFKTVKNSS